MAKGKSKSKGGGGRKGEGDEAGRAGRTTLPAGQRPGLVDRLTVLVGIAFAASLAWQHLPL